MTVGDCMTRDVVTVGPETPLTEIVELLVERRISAVPVVDEEMRVLGIVSESDLIDEDRRRLRLPRLLLFGVFSLPEEVLQEALREGGRLTARDVMSSRPVTLPESAPLGQATGLMVNRRVNHIPVTRDGRLVGIVARADLLRAMYGPATHEKPPARPEEG